MKRNIINLPSTLIKDRERYFLNFAINNPVLILNLKKVFSAGVSTKAQAFRLAGWRKQDYYSLRKIADIGLQYCELNNIDYRYTDYCSIIEAMDMLDKACEEKAFELVNIAVEHTKDVWGKNKDGEAILLKKGNPEIALKIAARLSEEWNDKTQIDVNINESKDFGVTINVVDFGEVIDIAADEQEELMKLTREKTK